jgi:hypothetical protein
MDVGIIGDESNEDAALAPFFFAIFFSSIPSSPQ